MAVVATMDMTTGEGSFQTLPADQATAVFEAQTAANAAKAAGPTSTFQTADGSTWLTTPLALPALPSFDPSNVNPSWVILGGMGVLATLLLLKPDSAPPRRRRR